jgi:hypothetical protein
VEAVEIVLVEVADAVTGSVLKVSSDVSSNVVAFAELLVDFSSWPWES